MLQGNFSLSCSLLAGPLFFSTQPDPVQLDFGFACSEKVSTNDFPAHFFFFAFLCFCFRENGSSSRGHPSARSAVVCGVRYINVYVLFSQTPIFSFSTIELFEVEKRTTPAQEMELTVSPRWNVLKFISSRKKKK